MKYILGLLAVIVALISSITFADSISEDADALDVHEAWWSFDAESYKPLGDGIIDQQASFDLQVFESFSAQSQISQTGEAFRTRGTSPTYALATTVNFLPLVGDFSVSFFVRIDAFSSQNTLLIFQTEGVQKGWVIYIDDVNRNLVFAASTDCTAENVIVASGNTTLQAARWYHVAVTYSTAGAATIYIDGVADVGGSIATVCFPVLPLYMLGGASGLDLYLDEVHIYDDVLTSAEISALKNIDADDFVSSRGFRFSFDVTDTSGSTSTNEQIMPAEDSATLVASGFMQADSDDIISTILGDSTATDSWMTFVGSIPGNGTIRYDHYTFDSSTGLDRNQPFISNSSDDTVTIPDHATLDITTNLGVSAQVNIYANPGATTYLVHKWTADTGYRLGINSSGDLVAQVDSTILTATPTNTYLLASMVYDGTNLFLFQDSLQLASIVAATLTANAEDVTLFNLSDAAISSEYIEIRSDQGQPGETKELIVTFETDDTTESDVGDVGDGWTWEGTFTDLSVNAHVPTYLITSDQSQFTIVEGPLVVVTSPLAASLAQSLFQSSWLANFSTDLITAPAAFVAITGLAGTVAEREIQRDNQFPLAGLINESATSAGIPAASLWFAFFLAAGLGIGGPIARQWLPLGLFGTVLIVLVGVLADLYAPWPVAVLGVFAFGSYGIDSLNRSGGI